MAIVDTRLTLLDFTKTKNPDGSIAEIVELMDQLSPILQDAPIYASNAPYGNRVTVRTSLPTVGTAKINKGVTRSKSTTAQRTDPIGFYSGRSETDKRIKDVEGALAYAKRRLEEDKAFAEALVQKVTLDFFYGNTTTDEASFDGIFPRMATTNTTDIKASLVRSQGSVTGSDGCSIAVVDWGERGVYMHYPPNTQGGIVKDDLGEIPVLDADSNQFQAGVTEGKWYTGVCVKDPRHMARLANIDLSDSALDSPTQGKIFDSMEQIFSLMPDPGGMQRVLYCPLRLYASFLKQARTVSNLALSMGEYHGKPTPMMWGYPLRRSDQMSVTESTVS